MSHLKLAVDGIILYRREGGGCIEEMPKLAFDHGKMIKDARDGINEVLSKM
jgi:hypothetical protein